MRLTLPVSVSSAIAWPAWAGGTASPIMRRRTDISAAHATPATAPPAMIAPRESAPRKPSSPRLPEVAESSASWPISTALRLAASPTAPISAPMNSIGKVRATVTTATSRVECVRS